MSRGKQIRARARARARARRRRTDHTQANQWSAVKASSTLVRKRDEVLARASNNPLITRVSRGMLADTFHRYTQRFVDQGADKGDARVLALTTIAHSSGLSPDDPDLIERLEHQQRTRELAPLRVGEPYVISPAMNATVAAAAQTLTAENVAGWPSADLLSEHGVLLLPHIQLVHEKSKTEPDEIVMLSWSTGAYTSPLDGRGARVIYLTAWFDADGPVKVPEFAAARDDAARRGYPLPSFGVTTSCRCELDVSRAQIERSSGSLTDWVNGVAGEQQSSSITVGEHSGQVIEVTDLGAWMQRYVFAFMGLAQQRIATVQRLRQMRATGVKPLHYDDVRVVQLRSFSPVGEDERQLRVHHCVVKRVWAAADERTG